MLDDQYALKQVDDAKQTTQATTLAGSKEYKDPSQIDTAQTETRVEEGQQDAQQLAPTDEVTSTDSTVSKGTDESASPALASTDEGTLNAQLHSDEMANNHTQDTTEDATQYPYSSSEIDTHEDATVSPDTYHAPDTHAQQPSSTDVSDSTTAKSDVTQANTSTNPNEKNAVSTTEDAFATQPQADVQPEVNKETKAATETAQNSTPQVNAKDTTQVENKATETQNTAQSATGNQESTEQLAKRTSVTNEAKMDATSAKTLAPASTTRQADTQAKTTADKKAPSVKATTDSAQTATDKDINANPDGPTPPRVGGKGGPCFTFTTIYWSNSIPFSCR